MKETLEVPYEAHYMLVHLLDGITDVDGYLFTLVVDHKVNGHKPIRIFDFQGLDHTGSSKIVDIILDSAIVEVLQETASEQHRSPGEVFAIAVMRAYNLSIAHRYRVVELDGGKVEIYYK